MSMTPNCISYSFCVAGHMLVSTADTTLKSWVYAMSTMTCLLKFKFDEP